jgi:hypothetical protein
MILTALIEVIRNRAFEIIVVKIKTLIKSNTIEVN